MKRSTARPTGYTGRWRFALVAGMAGAALLGACSSSTHTSSPSGGSSSTSARATGTPYTVGVIADLTGPAATLGQPQMNGVKAWANAVNASGGINHHPVNLVTCDGGGTPHGGVQCASQMGSARIVVDMSLIGSVDAALPSLTNDLVFATTPLLLPTRSADPNVFQTEPTIGAADAVALQAAKNNGIHSVGVIATDDATGTGAVKALQAEAANFGVTLSTQSVTESVTDATTQVLKLKSQNAGMLFVATPGGPAAAIVAAAKNLNFTGPVVVTSADTTNSFLASIASSPHPAVLYGAPATGAVVANSLAQPYEGETLAFEQRYAAETGKPVDYSTLLGYYTAQMAGDVLAALGSDASLSKMESYVDSTSLATIIGPLSFPSSTSNVESGANPALVQTNGSFTAWAACTSTASFKC